MFRNGSENSWRSEEALVTYIENLSKRIKIKAIILFGSRATGEDCSWSDYDLLVISDNLPRYLHQRFDLLWEEKPAMIDILGFTIEEAKEAIHRTLLLKALIQGIVLKGNADSLKALAHRYLEKEGLVPTPIGFTHREPAKESFIIHRKPPIKA